MKHLLLIIAFIGLSSFTVPTYVNSEISGFISYESEDFVEYCYSYDGNLFCCSAETYREAKSCAANLLKDYLAQD
ncbi:hypothetical protein [Rasiella sp. SM2506]|uniref:hypothetical protein n=1 Tax=Rasiella sp. SM2506 TaxID=3423914 RepID=UPI003D79E53A